MDSFIAHERMNELHKKHHGCLLQGSRVLAAPSDDNVAAAVAPIDPIGRPPSQIACSEGGEARNMTPDVREMVATTSEAT